MCDDGLNESLLEKLVWYSETHREDNLEFFRSTAAKLHSRASSQDKAMKEKTLEFISNPANGHLQLLIDLLQTVEDDMACSSVAGILHECVAPSAGKSRGSAINQLVGMNASQILVRYVIQLQNPSESLLLEVLWLLAQIAQRDPKFSVKIRLLGATKSLHTLLRSCYTNQKLLCPTLLIFKCLTKSASTTSVLVKDGILATLEKVLICIGLTPNMKLKLVLNITNYLTKSRLCCIRISKSTMLGILLRTFNCWERYEGKARLKICNYILITLQHLCYTKVGCQHICKLNGIAILHKFGVSCPQDKAYDCLLSRACHIINMCVERKQLPIDFLPSPATFNIPRLKTGDSKGEPLPKTGDSKGITPHDSSEDESDDDSDADSDDYEDADEDEEDSNSNKSKHKTYKLEAPIKHSIEDLAGYSVYFQEFETIDKRQPEKKLWSNVVSANKNTSADDIYSEHTKIVKSSSDHSFVKRCVSDSHVIKKNLSMVSDIDKDSGFRHAYSRLASRVTSVLPFMKIAYPDLMVGQGLGIMEPLNVKDRRICRAKLVACMEQVVKKMETSSSVVYDLDSLISEFPVPQQSDVKDRLLFNLDEANLGQKQAGKSHLCFESRFESGNLRKAIQVGEREYDLILMPDVNSSHHHQWFYFQVFNMEQGVPYTFNIINCEKQNSQFNYGMRPLMYSVQESVLGRPGWARVGTDICYYRNCYQNPTSRKSRSYLTTTFTITFQHAYDICYIAYHYPYTYSQLMSQIWKWSWSVDSSSIYLNAENLSLSLNNNETPVLTITATETDTNPIQGREVVFLTARVHPGESNSSWVMHGTISYLLSDTSSAVQLRNKFVFKIVPMLNPEGVINGCHRCGLSNEDLNRCWSRPNQYIHPVIYHTKGLLEYCVRVLKKSPIVFCDYHGHSRRKNVFFYGCSSADSWFEADRNLLENAADYLLLPHLMHSISPAFSLQQCSFQVEYERESTARVTVWREFGVKCSYTMESSFCGFDQGPYEGFHLNTNHLKEIGQHFCEALACLHDSSFWKMGSSPALSISPLLETNILDDLSDGSETDDDTNDDDDDDDAGDNKKVL